MQRIMAAFIFFFTFSMIALYVLSIPKSEPTIHLSISPENPTINDEITITVRAEDNSGKGLKKINILVNAQEVKACENSPCVFVGGPYPEGTLTYGANAYDNAGNRAWTGYLSVQVKKPVQISQKKITVTGSPHGKIDILALAATDQAQWSNGNVWLSFPGEQDDERGFACYRENVLLEDDNVYAKVLETHPEWRNTHGLIYGLFKIKNLPPKATFRTRVGFLKGAENSDGVEFKVYARKDPRFYAAKRSYHDGSLDDLAIYLDRYKGEDIELVLQVHVVSSSAQDWAVWVDPRIEL